MSITEATSHKFWRLQRRAYGATMPNGTPILQTLLAAMIRVLARLVFARKGLRLAASLIMRAALWRRPLALPNFSPTRRALGWLTDMGGGAP